MPDRENKTALTSLLRAGLFLILALAAGNLQAARIINAATVDGGSTTTVAPSATVSLSVTVTTTGGGVNNNWFATGWRVDTVPGALTCENHPNYGSSGTYNETFNITAPATPGSNAEASTKRTARLPVRRCMSIPRLPSTAIYTIFAPPPRAVSVWCRASGNGPSIVRIDRDWPDVIRIETTAPHDFSVDTRGLARDIERMARQIERDVVRGLERSEYRHGRRAWRVREHHREREDIESEIRSLQREMDRLQRQLERLEEEGDI